MAHQSNSIDVIAPRSRFFQGRFGRLVRCLPAWDPGVPEADLDAHLLHIANTLMTERPGRDPADLLELPAEAQQAALAGMAEDGATFDSGSPVDATTGIPAGYTYFGQFIDHDITFDSASELDRRNDPQAIDNVRTPRLDLDNLYGRGKADQPYIFDKKGYFLLGKVPGSKLDDLPRNRADVAIIGDKRNDENSIVSQMQLAFLRAHNELQRRAEARGMDNPHEAARTVLRYLYQWVVWNDFLERLCHNEIHEAALQKTIKPLNQTVWELGLGHVYKWQDKPYMPVEFSVAAFRFGHTMVRNAYQTNIHNGFGDFIPIFDNTTPNEDNTNLRGFRAMSEIHSLQWDWFLGMESRFPFPQRARMIDPFLANALTRLHEDEANPDSRMNILAFRNLKRGWSMDLPAGSAMADAYGITPLKLSADEPDALWYYILKEGGSLPGKNRGQMLGRLGSTIICAVFAGLLKGDPNAWINQKPNWTPDDEPLLQDPDPLNNLALNADGKDGRWDLASIIRLSGLPVSAANFEAARADGVPNPADLTS